jgi:hypothetical protein
MVRNALTVAVVLGLLTACSTPYRPPVVVKDSTSFPGIASVLAEKPEQAVDVILVHGMCTHTTAWAAGAFERMTGAIDANAPAAPGPGAATLDNAVQVVTSTRRAGGGTVRYHGLVWSPLTADLKRQLDYDNTGTPTDCATDSMCKPTRARFNGQVKDRLLNDCLSDAMIYEGASRPVIVAAMVDTLARVLAPAAPGAPLVVVAESLGSKLLFDALSEMLESDAPATRELGQRAARRLTLIFMAGNQLPILGLAEQQVAPQRRERIQAGDALQRFLALRRTNAAPAAALAPLSVVAFTDPNDLLAYRLLPSRYRAPDVSVADVLVSNSPTWLGLLEDPFAAHLDYLENPDVGRFIACGWPVSSACR